MDNKTLGYILLAGGAAWYFFGKSDTKEAQFMVNGQWVKASEMVQFGYVKFQGIFVHQNYLNKYLAGKAGGAKSSFDWQRYINEGIKLVNSAKDIWTEISDLFKSNPPANENDASIPGPYYGDVG